MQVILPPAPPDLAVLSSISFGSITTSTSSAYYAIETTLGVSEEEGIHVIKLQHKYQNGPPLACIIATVAVDI